ncbi:MAG: DNA polymerase, partial [Rickettsia endosymbiont of Ixodes persulcatus]|nr:DNA polymerase [Rickettsia endosymbiont of Ixodes persulcatus]
HGNLDNVMINAHAVKGKVGDNLRASLEQLPMARKLATIKTDVELDVVIENLKLKPTDNETLKTLYQEMEFKAWLNKVLESPSAKTAEPQQTYETIFTESDLDKWISAMYKKALFAFDTETTSLNYMDAKMVGVSFAIDKAKAAYIPLAHDGVNAPSQLNLDYVLEKLKPILEDPNIKKIGHNLKYDIEVLANYDIHMQGVAYDTMLESYILDSSSNTHNMDTAALKYLGVRTISFEDVAGKGAKQITFDKVSIVDAAKYSAEDADITWQLNQILSPRILKEPGLKSIYEDLEVPLISVLARMERIGVLVDAAMLKKQSVELENRLALLEEKIIEQAGGPFNLNSPKQLLDVLFHKLKLPILQKTPTGQPSTADPVLQELALEYDLPKYIIEYRGLSKLITTYTKKLPEQINKRTQRIHTSYNQTGAATGRLSSSDPNLQNIPIRTEEGRRIRQAFVAPAKHKIISADYSQIELRIMAHISQDPNLLKAFRNNLDVHTATAAEVLDLPLEKVTHEERRKAKAINFGQIQSSSP